jgi:MarR family transcriptional regulator, organic hydroperoxide resistance regulator
MPGKPQCEPGSHERHKPLPEQEVFLGIQRTADVLMRDLEEVLKPSGLSATQYNVLRILRGAGDDGLPCGGIGVRMLTRDPDITRLLDRLEARKLIRRHRSSEDRRVVLANVTASGLGLLKELDEPVIATHRRQLGHLGHEKLRQLSHLLEAARGPRE